MVGSVLDLEIMLLQKYAEFISIYKKPNHNIMHLDFFRKANSFTCKPFNPSAPGLMFSFYFLCVLFANFMFLSL